MSRRLQFVGGPRDGEWCTMHEGNSVCMNVLPAYHGSVSSFSTTPPSDSRILVHVYELAEWALDEGTVQPCLRYVGIKPY